MFPLQSDHIVPSILISDEQDKILEELLADYATPEGNKVISDKKKRKFQEKNGDDNELKKSMHRDMERQRRHEMSVLYASLRSLLPLEYVKGKRAVSDHMHQAVNYIKHTQKKIEEMRIRRDKLKNLSNAYETRNDRAAIIEPANTSLIVIGDLRHCVKVNLCSNGGMEILISNSISNFSISKVFVDLLQRGFNVVSCVSTRVDKGFLHKLQIEQIELTSIDVTELQEALVNAMKRA